MALTRKPKKDKKATPKVDEKKVEDLILKGGSIPKDKKKESAPEDLKFVQLRISQRQLDDIDKLVKLRPGKLSRHTWIMEAIFEKIRKDKEV